MEFLTKYYSPDRRDLGWQRQRLSLPPLRLRSGVREMLSELSSRSIATDGFIQLLSRGGGGGKREKERERERERERKAG